MTDYLTCLCNSIRSCITIQSISRVSLTCSTSVLVEPAGPVSDLKAAGSVDSGSHRFIKQHADYSITAAKCNPAPILRLLDLPLLLSPSLPFSLLPSLSLHLHLAQAVVLGEGLVRRVFELLRHLARPPPRGVVLYRRKDEVGLGRGCGGGASLQLCPFGHGA